MATFWSFRYFVDIKSKNFFDSLILVTLVDVSERIQIENDDFHDKMITSAENKARNIIKLKTDYHFC